jgi:hypothetical protein
MVEPRASICSLIRPSAVQIVCARSGKFEESRLSFFNAVMASSIIYLVGLLSNWLRAAIAGGDDLDRLLACGTKSTCLPSSGTARAPMHVDRRV